MALLENLRWEDGTPFEPPENPLLEKWRTKYPRIKMPQYSQVCDGWSCLWCERCPDGSDWEVPEEDKEEYAKFNKKYREYISEHGGFGKLTMDINEEEFKKYIYTIKSEKETPSYDNEMVSKWINSFKTGHQTKEDTIKEAKDSLSNESIWAAGCTDSEQIDLHNQNIANLKEFINRLEEMD